MQYSQSSGQSVLYYQGRYYPLDKPQIIVGSDSSCDIRIENNARVLPMHAQVISHGGQVFIQYMEREAAIWVNGAPASQRALRDQDEIALGDGSTVLMLRLNWKPEDVGQTVTRPGTAQLGSTRALQNGQNAGSYAAANADRPHTQGLAPRSPTPIRLAAASPLAAPGQMPPTTPPVGAGAGQQMIFAQQTPMSAMSSNTATNTTRYLCAAGHLDEVFQDYVMRHVIHEEHRALGESYGVDMLAVVSWCKAGLARINLRDSILGIIFLVIGSILAFRITQEIASTIQLVSETNQYYSQYYGSGYSVPPQQVLLLMMGEGLGLNLGLVIILLISLGVEAAIKRRWRNSYPGFASLLVLMILLGQLIPFGLSFLITLALWLTIYIELLSRFYGERVNQLSRGTFNPQVRPAALDFHLENKLRGNFATENRNVIAYSGYRPFAGAGYYQHGWSFVVDTSKGVLDPSSSNERLTPRPFTLGSLYSKVEKDLRALGVNDVLEIEEKLYVNGQFLPENPAFFDVPALRPVTNVTPQLVEQYKEHPTEDVRYYQCLRFNLWRGEMVFTAFLRFIQRGKDLFTEMDYLLLPPMKDIYYWVDRKPITPTVNMVWSLFKLSFSGPLSLWFGVPRRLLRGPIYAARQRKLAQIARNSPAFDYGAATSLRWEASDDTYHLFFQKLDEEMYLKIVEAQVLETIVNFLELHQIDTTELRERQQSILNNNTYVNGENINIGAMATGTGGQANNHAAPSPRGNAARTSGGGQAQPRSQS